MKPASTSPSRQQVAPGLQAGGGVREDLVRQCQGARHRRLERRAVDVGEELLDRRHRLDELRRSADPADLPAGHRERLAGAGDGERALGHAGQGRERHVPASVEQQVLVHLVGDHQQVVLDRAPRADLGQLRRGEHLPGRVVRRVEQDHPGPRPDGARASAPGSSGSPGTAAAPCRRPAPASSMQAA